MCALHIHPYLCSYRDVVYIQQQFTVNLSYKINQYYYIIRYYSGIILIVIITMNDFYLNKYFSLLNSYQNKVGVTYGVACRGTDGHCG